MQRGFVFAITPPVFYGNGNNNKWIFFNIAHALIVVENQALNHKYTKERFSSLEDLAAHRDGKKKRNLQAYVTRKQEDKMITLIQETNKEKKQEKLQSNR